MKQYERAIAKIPQANLTKTPIYWQVSLLLLNKSGQPTLVETSYQGGSVLRAANYYGLVNDLTVSMVTRNRKPHTADELKAIWQKQKYEDMDWNFHDLKAKGKSDFEGDKQEFSGHKSRLMMERYNRSPDKVQVIDFPPKTS